MNWFYTLGFWQACLGAACVIAGCLVLFWLVASLLDEVPE